MFPNMNKGDFRIFGKPIVIIKINGQKVANWKDFKVDINGLGDVDSFNIKLPWDVSDKPHDELLYSGSKSSSIIVNGGAEITIEAGFEGENVKLLIDGKMDNAHWNFDSDDGESVEIKGRSLAAAPYDFKETVKYQNLTATDAHAQIAVKHGLNPVAPIRTSAMIGEYINDDHATVTRETSHWDFVLYLAENEGFVSRVRGKEWYFGPVEMLPGFSEAPLSFSWGHNILSPLEFERAPNAARNLIVEVISWQPGKKKGKGTRIVEKASFTTSSSGHKYTIREYRPNITRDQAQRLAQNFLLQMSKEQITGSFSCDFFTELDNDRRIALHGVGAGLSQIYFISRLELSGDKEQGLQAALEFSNLPLSESGSFK